MSALDWTIIAVYLAAMIGLAVYLGRSQTNEEDYYVGGRNLPWWAVGVSTMATQAGLISFVSIPAFVALAEGGGFSWLQYELALPLAMIAVMVVLIPFFRKLELVSVYEYLEARFNTSVRLTISAIFLLARGGATGITIFTAALVLRECLPLDEMLIGWLGEGADERVRSMFGFGLGMLAIILVVGIVTIIYDTIGGMAGVVYSDVIQMVVLLAGIGVCIYFAADLAGGFGEAIRAFPEERWRAIEPSMGFGGEPMPFWAFLIGGFFLYASYYGADQSQTQRELSAPTLRDTKRALVINAVGRFPLMSLYAIMGVMVGAALLQLPELQEQVQARWDETGSPDSLVPLFIVHELPAGIRAVILAAMLAAAMSSLDSALNSLSASTVRDFLARGRTLTAKQSLRLSKLTTIGWGVAIILFGLFVNRLGGSTVIEMINRLGSLFYGPILAAFVVGVLSSRATAPGVIAGVLGGVALNLVIGIAAPEVHWMWWNLTGFAATYSLALIVSGFAAPPRREQIERYTLRGAGMLEDERKWLPTYAVLFGYFVVMLAILAGLYKLAG
jgi:Na+/proline symporter